MTYHPHIHMIVPGGGISLDGERWISSRAGFLLPVRMLAKLFRRLLLTKLQQLHAAGRLAFFGDHVSLSDRRAFLRHLTPLRKKRCRVDGDVAAPIPHRPGRADSPHPVLHERDSLAAA
ncbi:MAG: transposase [Planctomycetaceae bacterium]|nr:transposase [Planctomycetaceae bacterium]